MYLVVDLNLDLGLVLERYHPELDLHPRQTCFVEPCRQFSL